MPQSIPLQAVPNQNFTINVGGNLFDITLQSTNGVMSVSMTINGVDTLDGIRCVAYAPLIPSKYQEAGNFLFITSNNQIPDYTQFNITQSLIYFTPAELTAFRLPPTLPITDAFFNPNGALPLRFAPQGYVLA